MLSLNFASKILDTNIKSCLTPKRVEQILLHDTNSILQIPLKRGVLPLIKQNLQNKKKKKRVVKTTAL